MIEKRVLASVGFAVAMAVAAAGHAQQHRDGMAPPVRDGRTLVHFPERMRAHTLANMRDHLRALQEIQQALAASEFGRAGEIAERRLGMSALESHGSFERAKHMPEGMRAIGSEMHRSASRFAIAARDAEVAGDLNAALAALVGVTEQCVACHSAYRVR